jgi:phosphoglycerate dehydrogenase-like enzyme
LRAGYFLPATEEALAIIKAEFPVWYELVPLPRPGAECEVLPGLDFVVAHRFTMAMAGAARRLRMLQLPGVGYDQVDPAAVASLGIPVAQGLAGSDEEVAEHTMLLMLAVSRHLIELDRGVKAGEWPCWTYRVHSHSLYGRTLGLIGYGRIARQVHARAKAFGMRVLHTGRRKGAGIGHVLRDSDIVSLHLRLDASTHHILDAGRIAMMKPGAILINTARGGLVDEAALAAALESGRLAGAGLDVLEHEPARADNPLLRLANVVLTPHTATGTIESLRAKARLYRENFERVVAGGDPLGLVRL